MKAFIDDHRAVHGSSRSAGCCRLPHRHTAPVPRARRPQPGIGENEAGCHSAAGDYARLGRELQGLRGSQGLASNAARRHRCGALHRYPIDAADGPAGRGSGETGENHDQQPGHAVPADHVNRQFRAPRPNRLWVSDFTYVSTWSGFVFVAFVLDTFARRIVGWRASRTAHTDFVLDALEQALHDRRPARQAGLVHHSDSEYLRAGSLGVT